MDELAPTPLVEIVRYPSWPEAEAGALVLTAVGVGCRLQQEGSEVGLSVSAADAIRARRELVEYARENGGRAQPALRPAAADGIGAALTYAAALAFIYAAAARRLFGIDWLSAGHAEAGAILGGEWWRALTALSLHVDFDHLASNMVAGALLAVLITPVLGAGLTWLSILLAGGIGNGLNALVQPADHAAIGASTAVFAALGLLAALKWRRDARNWARGLRRWLPLAAGIALLAFLGTGGERTDVGAHVMGFLTGIGFGAGLHVLGARVPQGRSAQATYGIVALLLFCLAWLFAIASGAPEGPAV